MLDQIGLVIDDADGVLGIKNVDGKASGQV